ncbi:hypothetical protein AVEN_95242-1 [Araneus ventricosus]|uniref:Uncharacterized protein n=1 Tax=Araneus ventricosus TaxID=182803 RepID=A0A4Y2DFN4_ARAVE|nr:hypothetical protein AVEN_95242-1 [Araneus ventricosus]
MKTRYDSGATAIILRRSQFWMYNPKRQRSEPEITAELGRTFYRQETERCHLQSSEITNAKQSNSHQSANPYRATDQVRCNETAGTSVFEEDSVTVMESRFQQCRSYGWEEVLQGEAWSDLSASRA